MAINVLFVCLGNICRSPMAEAVFSRLVEEEGLANHFQIDSAGTSSYHVGERAHPGTRGVLAKHGIRYNGRSRQVVAREMADQNTYVIAMDSANIRDLERRFGSRTRLAPLLAYAQNSDREDVPDPYYEGNFEYVYQLVEDGCLGLLAAIRKEEGI